MIHLDRVANEIKHIGFYDMLYQDIKDRLDNPNPTEEEIKDILQKEPKFLQDYKQLNIEYNISNIHIKDIPLDNLDKECIDEAKRLNEKLAKLRELEPFTLEFEKSSFLVILFSVEFFVLFSVQYFIVLLSLKEYQWYIYGFFLLSIVISWWVAKRQKKKFTEGNIAFEKLLKEIKEELKSLEDRGCIEYESLIIKESDEHVKK